MYVCVCARVREGELRAVIADGAATESAVGDACGAGTGCGSCVHRIRALLECDGARSASLAGAT